MGEKEPKRKIITNDGMFLNAKCVLVEYSDIIRAPYWTLIELINKDPTWVKPPIIPQPILAMNTEELVEWYLNRRHPNALIDLIPKDKLSTADFDKIGELANSMFDKDLINFCPLLLFQQVIGSLLFMDGMLVGDVLFYHPYKNDAIEEDIKNLYNGTKAKFVYGDIVDVIRDMPIDSTYVFSNMANMEALIKTNHLDYSSIIMADDYAYNRNNDNSDYIIDLIKLNETHPFKFNTFIATTDE